MTTHRTRRPSNAISYQVAVRGKGIAQLEHDALTELIEHTLDGTEPPRGVTVQIQCWRAGSEIDMTGDNSRAVTLRETFRRLLLSGGVHLEVRGGSEDHE